MLDACINKAVVYYVSAIHTVIKTKVCQCTSKVKCDTELTVKVITEGNQRYYYIVIVTQASHSHSCSREGGRQGESGR